MAYLVMKWGRKLTSVITKRAIFVVPAIMLAAATFAPAEAEAGNHGWKSDKWKKIVWKIKKYKKSKKPHEVPEIDAASGTAALGGLLAAMAFAYDRRRRNV